MMRRERQMRNNAQNSNNYFHNAQRNENSNRLILNRANNQLLEESTEISINQLSNILAEDSNSPIIQNIHKQYLEMQKQLIKMQRKISDVQIKYNWNQRCLQANNSLVDKIRKSLSSLRQRFYTEMGNKDKDKDEDKLQTLIDNLRNSLINQLKHYCYQTIRQQQKIKVQSQKKKQKELQNVLNNNISSEIQTKYNQLKKINKQYIKQQILLQTQKQRHLIINQVYNKMQITKIQVKNALLQTLSPKMQQKIKENFHKQIKNLKTQIILSNQNDKNKFSSEISKQLSNMDFSLKQKLQKSVTHQLKQKMNEFQKKIKSIQISLYNEITRSQSNLKSQTQNLRRQICRNFLLIASQQFQKIRITVQRQEEQQQKIEMYKLYPKIQKRENLQKNITVWVDLNLKLRSCLHFLYNICSEFSIKNIVFSYTALSILNEHTQVKFKQQSQQSIKIVSYKQIKQYTKDQLLVKIDLTYQHLQIPCPDKLKNRIFSMKKANKHRYQLSNEGSKIQEKYKSREIKSKQNDGKLIYRQFSQDEVVLLKTQMLQLEELLQINCISNEKYDQIINYINLIATLNTTKTMSSKNNHLLYLISVYLYTLKKININEREIKQIHQKIKDQFNISESQQKQINKFEKLLGLKQQQIQKSQQKV